MPIVYQATNNANGKKYIGVCKRTLTGRISQHVHAAKNNGKMVFSRAIKKYGIESFDFIVLHEVSSYEDALFLEREAIKNLRPEYNTAAGGRGPSGVKWSAERRALSVKSLIASWTPERKTKASITAKAMMTPERIAIAKTFKPPVINKSVTCLTDGMVFPSVKSAAEYYGIGVTNIISVCRGRQLSAGGVKFAYSVDAFSQAEILRLLSVSASKEEDNEKMRGLHRRRSVMRTSDGAVFQSMKEASTKCGISRSTIWKICNGVGAGFRYSDQDNDLIRILPSSEQLAAAKQNRLSALSRGVAKNSKRIVCIDSGVIYKSISDAARAHNVHVSALSAGIYRNGRTAGLKFEFARAA